MAVAAKSVIPDAARWTGGPKPQRVNHLRRNFFYDGDGQVGKRGGFYHVTLHGLVPVRWGVKQSVSADGFQVMETVNHMIEHPVPEAPLVRWPW